MTAEREQCGDYEIYKEGEWWVVKQISTGVIIGKFLTKDDALEKVAIILQDIDEETESVC